VAKRIYFHIGAHKSASTTLQVNMNKNRGYFEEEHGLSFLSNQDITGSEFCRHFKRISSKGVSLNQDEYEKSIEKARISLDGIVERASGDDVFISWEGILGHSALDVYGGIYTHSDLVAESLRLISKNYPTKILMVVRKQDSFIESCYLQQIKEGRSISFNEFVDQIDVGNISWKPVVDNFSLLFDNNFFVVPFEIIKELGTASFLEKVLSYVLGKNLSLDGVQITSQTNASMSNYGVDIAREVFPHLCKKNRDLVRKILFKDFSSAKFGKATFLNKFTRRLVNEKTTKDNLWLFDNYLKRFYLFVGLSGKEREWLLKSEKIDDGEKAERKASELLCIRS